MHLSAGRLIILDIAPKQERQQGKRGGTDCELSIVSKVSGTNGGDVLETRYNFKSAG